MSNKTFAEKCYSILLKVPEGKVTTYKDIAHALDSKAYRAVGMAMSKNPNIPTVPCHRVVCSDGSLGGYALGVPRKAQMLKDEGIDIRSGAVSDLDNFRYRFT